MADGDRRPKRRCARSRAASGMPSAVHYVGYVEDDETPEMIMAKFLELERIQRAADEAKKAPQPAEQAAAAGDGVPPADAAATADGCGNEAAVAADGAQDLTDEQLLQVFKQTSMFNVRTALQENAMLMGIDEVLEYANERYGTDEELSDDDDFLRSFWSDDDEGGGDGDFDEGDEFGGRRKARRRGSGGQRSTAASRLQRNIGTMRARHNTVTAYIPGSQALVRRKVRVADPDEIVHVRVPPPPLPLSWGRTVQPYAPLENRGLREEAVLPAVPPAGADGTAPAAAAPTAAGAYLEVAAVGRLDFKSLDVPAFQAVLIGPGWVGGPGDAALSALSALPLPLLVPAGFVFIWTPKQHIHAVCKQMGRWGYSYIENLTWVWLGPDAAVMRLPSKFVRSSHLTLYMFRSADKGRDIELRHQRNPDVTFDCLAAADCSPMSVPEEAFVAVETLLPTGRGKFLELWAPRGVRRPGWTHVVQVGP